MSRKHKKPIKYDVPELGRRENRRPNRVADVIRNELSVLLLREVQDPRLSTVSITKVDVSPDLRTADIYFNCRKSEDVKDAQVGLTRASGFMRSSLAKCISLRYMPKLIFKYDLSAVYQEEMDQIFREISNDF